VHRITCKDVNGAAHRITDLFDRTLRHVAKQDQWLVSGRDHFLQKVERFVSRNVPIELCLPAFPCKSSNLDKVSGTLPDRGERIALETLHAFVCAVQKIHDPGSLLWIISDGHVFSDCSKYCASLFSE
jgi:pyoverdine/dityrosine biosynthesis protein Dit1